MAGQLLVPASDPLEDQIVRELACRWARDFLLEYSFAIKLARVYRQLERETGSGFRILSGHRDAAKQQELIDEGLGAPIQLSNHTLCPAHAADVWPLTTPVTTVRAALGRAVVMNGLRWGGCDPRTPGCVSPDTGIPKDWNHIDDGPRWQKGR